MLIALKEEEGSRDITLNVTDDDGAWNTTTVPVQVNEFSVDITYLPDMTIYGEKMSVEFEASVSDPTDSLTYEWDWGDGSVDTTTVPTATHEYDSSDSYTLTLTVSDGAQSSSEEATISVGVDEDQDGLTDSTEGEMGTDPTKADTDNDHLLDYYEDNRFYRTDPTKDDTDEDGMLDWYELSYFGGPNVDLDNDGLPCQLDWDSDGDMVSDGDEYESNPKVYNDPLGVERENYDAIVASSTLNVSVVVYYEGISEEKPKIKEGTDKPSFNHSTGKYFDIGVDTSENFHALVKAKYEQSLPDQGDLRVYGYESSGWNVLFGNDMTNGVNTSCGYTYLQTTSFGNFTIGDAGETDYDDDGLYDAEEVHSKDYFFTVDQGSTSEASTSSTGLTTLYEKENILLKGEYNFHIKAVGVDESEKSTLKLTVDSSEGETYEETWNEKIPEPDWFAGLYMTVEGSENSFKIEGENVEIKDMTVSPESGPSQPFTADSDNDGLNDFSEREFTRTKSYICDKTKVSQGGNFQDSYMTQYYIFDQFIPGVTEEAYMSVAVDVREGGGERDVTVELYSDWETGETLIFSQREKVDDNGYVFGGNIGSFWLQKEYYTKQYDHAWRLDVFNEDHQGKKGIIVVDYTIQITKHADPLDKDTDNDGLEDGEEVHDYGTDPVDKDTDDDRVNDSLEANGWDSMVDGQIEHFYGDPTDPSDRDGDGWNDFQEWMNKTDPSDDDTDGDGTQDNNDMNPLVDLELTVEIKELNQLDIVDPGEFMGGDFYVKVLVEGEKKQSSKPSEGPKPLHTYPGWEFTWDIQDSLDSVPVEIELLDNDALGTQRVDISPSSDEKEAEIEFDPSDGLVKGRDDGINDDNGYLHISGEGDGNNDVDVELWYDVHMNDNDGDGVPHNYEINNGLDVAEDDGDEDQDDDKMSNRYEAKYGFDADDPSDNETDSDGDGLLNVWESKLDRSSRDTRNVFEISLSVSLEWDASDEYIEKLKNGFRGASLYMMTVTDGYAYISEVTIYEAKENWGNVNVRIGDQNATEGDKWWPKADVNGYWDGISWNYWGVWWQSELILPRLVNGTSPNYGAYYDGIVHELGHYVFGFHDEYRWGLNEMKYDKSDITWKSLMTSNRFYLSYNDWYDDLFDNHAPTFPIPSQYSYRHMSCWEWFYQQMGYKKVLIGFDDEARQEDYIPLAASRFEHGENRQRINYEFSFHSWNAEDENFEEICNQNRVSFNITQMMDINEGG